jgi:hypothetical protein
MIVLFSGEPPAQEGGPVAAETRLFIGGQWSPRSSDGVLTVVSPHTEDAIATTAVAGPEVMD